MCGSICSNDNTQDELKVYVLTYLLILLRVQQGWLTCELPHMQFPLTPPSYWAFRTFTISL